MALARVRGHVAIDEVSPKNPYADDLMREVAEWLGLDQKYPDGLSLSCYYLNQCRHDPERIIGKLEERAQALGVPFDRKSWKHR